MIDALSLVSAGVATLGNLLIGVFAWRGGGRRARDFATLCFALSVWTGAVLGQVLFSEQWPSTLLWLVALPLPPLAWRFVLGGAPAPDDGRGRVPGLLGVVSLAGGAGLVLAGEPAIPWLMPYLFAALFGAVGWLILRPPVTGGAPRRALGVGGGFAALLSLADALPYLGIEWLGGVPRLTPLGTLLLAGLLASDVARHRRYQITPLLSGAVTMAVLSLLVAALVLWPAETGAGDRPGRLLFASLLLFGFVLLQPPLQRFLRGPFQRQRTRRRERFLEALRGLDAELPRAADPAEPLRLLTARLRASPEVGEVEVAAGTGTLPAAEGCWVGHVEAGERRGGTLRVRFQEAWMCRDEAITGALASALSRVSTVWHALELQQEVLRTRNLARLGTLSAGVAHEIRNPLGAIRGALDLLDDPDLPAEARRWWSIVREESARLDRFVEEVLEFARVPTARRRPCSLRDLLEEVRTRAAASADPAITLAVEAPPAAPAIVDPDLMRHALRNLVGNALQACAARRATVTLAADATTDGGGWLEVRDDGPGVPAALREQVFDPFFTTRAEGTGLGLAIVRQIAEAHQGSLELREQEPGGGACFRLSWPPAPPETSP